MSQPLTAADLAEARAYSKGSIWRQPLTGDEMHAMYCAPEGGQHADPVPTNAHSMAKHRKTAARAAAALIAAPAIAAAVGVISFIAQHWPG